MIRMKVQRRSGRVWLVLAAVIPLISWFTYQGWAVATVWIKSSADPGSAAVALVLGDSLTNGQMNDHFRQRLDRAFDLYRTQAVGNILVSGGGQPREATVGKDYLASRGIPPERILTETESCSTEENIANSKVLLAKADLPGPVLLVTNGFHLRRALAVAEHHGLQARGVAAEGGPPLIVSALPRIVRETLAVVTRSHWFAPPQCSVT